MTKSQEPLAINDLQKSKCETIVDLLKKLNVLRESSENLKDTEIKIEDIKKDSFSTGFLNYRFNDDDVIITDACTKSSRNVFSKTYKFDDYKAMLEQEVADRLWADKIFEEQHKIISELLLPQQDLYNKKIVNRQDKPIVAITILDKANRDIDLPKFIISTTENSTIIVDTHNENKQISFETSKILSTSRKDLSKILECNGFIIPNSRVEGARTATRTQTFLR
jgi:hypothetical protein